MKIASILENQSIEKRIAITPEIAKKYISLGFEVNLSQNYGVHLGILDEEYIKLGVKTSKDENQTEFTKEELGYYINEQLETGNEDEEIDSEIQIFQNALVFQNVKSNQW